MRGRTVRKDLFNLTARPWGREAVVLSLNAYTLALSAIPDVLQPFCIEQSDVYVGQMLEIFS